MLILENDTFRLHALDGYIATLYLVEYPEKMLLLDGGCRCDADTVLTYIKQINRSIDDLKLIVITHPHPDHSGGAPRLQTLYNIPIAASLGINDWYRGLSGWLTQQTDILLTYYVARKKKRPWKDLRFPRSISIDYPIVAGKSLPLFPDWQLLATPGHTTTDCSLVHKTESVVYLADLLIGLGSRYHPPYPIADPTQYRASLDSISAKDMTYCLLAHHGLHTIDRSTFEQVKSTVSDRPKNHRNSIRAWFRY